MEMPQNGVEDVTLTEILGLDTWNEERSNQQLQNFIERRHAAIHSDDEAEVVSD